MGHLLFWMLHIAAIMFGFWGLIITIPLHLIYSNSRRTAKAIEAAQKSNASS